MDETKVHLAALLSDSDPAVRRRAAEELAGSTGFAPIAALAAALRDENKGVRDAASRSLSQIGSKNVARAVVEYLGDGNITTRNLAAELLMQLKDESVEALLPYLYDPDPNVRKFVVDILGVNGSTQAVSHLVDLLKDPDENVVISAVEALGNIGSEDAIEPLVKAFEEIGYAGATAAEAIGKIGGVKATDFLLAKVDLLIGNPKADPVALYALIEALSVVGYDQAYAVLRAHIYSVKGKLRRILLHAFIKIGERCGIALSDVESLRADLIEALRDDNKLIQLSAAKGLGNLEGDDVTAALVKAIGRNEELDGLLLPLLEYRPGVFTLVVQAVEAGHLKATKEVVGLLAKLISHIEYLSLPEEFTDPGNRLLQRAFDVVRNGWADANEETRSAIADALFKLDGDQAVEALDVIRNDSDPWLRMHVIELLMPLEDRRIPEFISRFLGDEDEMVRELAATSLEARGYSLGTADVG